jgi:hypothetical protein
MTTTRGMRPMWGRWAVALATGAIIAVAGAGFAGATAAPPSIPRTLAVSVPPDATSIAPGKDATVPVRVVNGGAHAIVVTLTERGVVLGNDGSARITVGPDPRWQNRVALPVKPFTIPARSYVTVPVTVRLPARISPDLYFIGFVVTPQASSVRGIAVVNQIGAFLTIDVPGPRLRQISAVLIAPNLVFGTSTHGSVRIRNIGHASAQLWGENDTTSSPGGGIPTQQRIDKSLLPVGTARSFTVTGKPAWPIGIVTMKIHLIYPYRDANATTELVATQRILVVNPLALAATLGALTVVALAWGRRRRRRRKAVNDRPRGKPQRAARERGASNAKGRARRAAPRRRESFEDRLHRARSDTGDSHRG